VPPDRPRPTFQRLPAKGAAFPQTGCFPPSRSAGGQEDHSSSLVLRRPLAHAAHTFSPGWGKVSCRALQARPSGSPRPGAFERASAFFTCRLVIPCLDLTTQARPQARSAWPWRGLFASLVPTPAAAPRRLLRPSDERSLLGLRAYRQPDKPAQRLGTLSCL
jgi:hypothetical protein